MAHCFGELAPQTDRTVAQHLLACDQCRLEFHRLSAAREPVVTADDVEELLGRLRKWEAKPAQDAEALKRRVAGAIEPYLGKRAADTLLQSVREDGRDLLSGVAPLLTVFLGRRAAGNLISHVVDTAIVSI